IPPPVAPAPRCRIQKSFSFQKAASSPSWSLCDDAGPSNAGGLSPSQRPMPPPLCGLSGLLPLPFRRSPKRVTREDRPLQNHPPVREGSEHSQGGESLVRDSLHRFRDRQGLQDNRKTVHRPSGRAGLG